MSGDQNAWQSHNIKMDNSFFERVEQFTYLGKTLTNKNSIQDEIKSRLKSGNVSYHSVQNLLCSNLLSKNTKIKIYGSAIFPVVLYGCETWSLTFREESRLRVLFYFNYNINKNVNWGCLRMRVLRRIFGPKRDRSNRGLEKKIHVYLTDLYSSPDTIRVIK